METRPRYVRRRLNGGGANIEALVDEARQRRTSGLALRDRLCTAARAHAVPLASHDDTTPEQAEANAARGITISEFPYILETAQWAR